jgi:hypothetical protein
MCGRLRVQHGAHHQHAQCETGHEQAVQHHRFEFHDRSSFSMIENPCMVWRAMPVPALFSYPSK